MCADVAMMRIAATTDDGVRRGMALFASLLAWFLLFGWSGRDTVRVQNLNKTRQTNPHTKRMIAPVK